MRTDKQYLINLYHERNPEMPLHECMREVNRLHCEPGALAFAPVDVNFLEFVHLVRQSASQRELDLIEVSSFFHSSYTTLRADIAGLHKMSTKEKDDVMRTYNALSRMELPHLMEDGLSKKWVTWLRKEAYVANQKEQAVEPAPISNATDPAL